jgi:hypothetical protein
MFTELVKVFGVSHYIMPRLHDHIPHAILSKKCPLNNNCFHHLIELQTAIKCSTEYKASFPLNRCVMNLEVYS